MGIVAPMPTVGVNGLVPNARRLLQYIATTYPVFGPSACVPIRFRITPAAALDVMIGSDMGLRDAINADIQSQAARFGVSYTMWRWPHTSTTSTSRSTDRPERIPDPDRIGSEV